MPRSARAALAYVGLFVAIGAEAPYLILYYRSQGLDLGQMGAIAAGSGLVGLAAGPAWGSVSDRFGGGPWVVALAASVAAAGAAALLLASGLVPLLAAATVLFVGLAGVAPIVDAR